MARWALRHWLPGGMSIRRDLHVAHGAVAAREGCGGDAGWGAVAPAGHTEPLPLVTAPPANASAAVRAALRSAGSLFARRLPAPACKTNRIARRCGTHACTRVAGRPACSGPAAAEGIGGAMAPPALARPGRGRSVPSARCPCLPAVCEGDRARSPAAPSPLPAGEAQGAEMAYEPERAPPAGAAPSAASATGTTARGSRQAVAAHLCAHERLRAHPR